MDCIQVQELTKIYQTGFRKGNILALDQVSVTIKPGEIFGLLGPNGAGKTTLVKILLGIVHSNSGTVLVNGLSPHDPESRLKVGFLPENHRFPPHLTGLGLLELAGRLQGLPEQELDHQAEGLLATVGMDKWASTKLSKYSKGMAQRIGLAQAMMGDPDILLLDEPTDGVDPVGKMEIRQVLQKLRQQGKTVLLNSHLLSEVESVADRVAILVRGKLLRVDTVAALTNRKSQYEIEAEIGEESIEIPAEMGKRLFIARDRLVVELMDDTDINRIIDELRLRRISIRSVKPLKISLEQSFFETVTERRGESPL
ncbi:MAG: ABC transporter ATP-binding protein [Candidatus Zixiibacteriota bacterium]